MKEFLKQILYIPFYNLMIFFAYLTGGSLGWAIILVTIAIRILLLPSSLKAAKAQTLLSVLQPKINEVRQKFKDDSKKQNEEIMKIYKESGTSPFGCCGPMVIQLVVIIILYRVFLIGFDTSNYNLLYSFTPRPEVIKAVFMGIDLSKPELWILPILAGITQLILSIMTMPKTDKNKKNSDPSAAITKQMTYLFPIMTIFIGRSLQAGLVLYWIITTLFSIAQQVYVNKNIRGKILEKKEEIEAEIEEDIEEAEEKKEEKGDRKGGVVNKIMKRRIEKENKKKGIEVTIREKK